MLHEFYALLLLFPKFEVSVNRGCDQEIRPERGVR